MWKLIKYLFTQKTVGPKRTAISFAINDYPGSGSDLRGCVNDQLDLFRTLKENFPEFKMYGLTNEQVTIYNFLSTIRREIDRLVAGDILLIHYSGHGTYLNDISGDEEDGYDEALYLYDGALIDDDINEILHDIPEGADVIIMLDCCYSGTATRDYRTKDRFLPIRLDDPPFKKVKTRLAKDENMNWILFSGSGEHQTSADAYIDGDYHGAFTYFATQLMHPGYRYNEWYQWTRRALASNGFDQIPQLEGNTSKFNDRILYYNE